MTEITYGVDFNFTEINGRTVPMNIKTGFTAHTDAEAWARENTADGKVIRYEAL